MSVTIGFLLWLTLFAVFKCNAGEYQQSVEEDLGQKQQQSEDEYDNLLDAGQQDIMQQVDLNKRESVPISRFSDSLSLMRDRRQAQHQCRTPQSPSPGSVQCSYGDGTGRKECTGTCAKGYVFPNGQSSKTLQCNSGTWLPYSTFPRCKSTGECKFQLASAGSFSCNTNNRGKYCDIKCLGTPPINDRFLCTPGQGWSPRLPYCVQQKAEHLVAPSCNCQNGGTCDPYTSRCTCLPGYEGLQCEKRRLIVGHCGIEFTGASYKCDTNNRGFYCEIRCLSPEPIYGRFYCGSGGSWSPPLPHCAKSIRS